MTTLFYNSLMGEILLENVIGFHESFIRVERFENY